MEYRKVYCDVTVKQKKDGTARPLSVVLEDGLCYPIDKVIYVTRAAAPNVGGYGIRYTVMLGGQEVYLYDDRGRWFMEVSCFSV